MGVAIDEEFLVDSIQSLEFYILFGLNLGFILNLLIFLLNVLKKIVLNQILLSLPMNRRLVMILAVFGALVAEQYPVTDRHPLEYLCLYLADAERIL